MLDFTKKATASASQLSTEHATLMTEVPPLLVLLHDCNLTDAKLKKDWKASLSKQLKNLDTMERKLVKHSDKLEQAKSQDAIAQCIWIYILDNVQFTLAYITNRNLIRCWLQRAISRRRYF